MGRPAGRPRKWKWGTCAWVFRRGGRNAGLRSARWGGVVDWRPRERGEGGERAIPHEEAWSRGGKPRARAEAGGKALLGKRLAWECRL